MPIITIPNDNPTEPPKVIITPRKPACRVCTIIYGKAVVHDITRIHTDTNDSERRIRAKVALMVANSKVEKDQATTPTTL